MSNPSREDENEISLHEYIIMCEEALIEMDKDIRNMTSSIDFFKETLQEMKDAEWVDNSEEKNEQDNE